MVFTLRMTILQALISTKLSRCFSSRNILRLRERGMYQDIFPRNSASDILDICNASPQTVYAGFDPTARSLHMGNLLILISLIHWQRNGHQPIALVGGATGRIGDPSGRSKERELLERISIYENTKGIIKCIQKIFDNHQKYFYKDEGNLKPIMICDNSTWYESLNVIDFICGIGRYFRMGTMLSRTSVASRLASEAGMSFTEFSYQAFQAYDWLHLFREFNCRFQLGGSDQMGNIMSGQELISRLNNSRVYGLTLPLIKSKSGDKYGKSGGNAVWLDPGMTSPFDLYQFLLRTPDAEVGNLLRLFTFLPLSEIQQLVDKHMKRPELRLAQEILAENVTLLIHGDEDANMSKRKTSVIYKSSLEDLSKMSCEELSKVLEASTTQILLQPGITVLDMALTAKCFLTRKDAERIIQAGGFYINQTKAVNPNEILVPGTHILPNNVTLARVGKKNYFLIKWLT